MPVACANAVSSVSVTVGDTVDLGISGGCSYVSVSAAGNLEPLSQSSFLAFAAGSGSIIALVVDSNEVQYLNRVNVSIASKPAPQPTPAPTTSPAPTSSPISTAQPSPSVSASPTSTVSAAATPTPSYDLSDLRPVVASSTNPAPAQRLVKRDIKEATNAGPGNVVIESSNGNPLQLLEIRGDSDAFDVVSAGMNYGNPANWQRLGYGDLCWSYDGYQQMQAVILPIADPPFTTVAGTWDLTSAILVTRVGYTTFVGASPGDVVDAEGADISSVIICGKAPANETMTARFAPASNQGRVTICHKPGTPAQATRTVTANALSGHLRHGDYIGACSRTPQITLPSLPPAITATTTSTPTPEPSHPAIVDDDHVLHTCRATGDSGNPYVLDSIRLSQVPQPPQDSGPYPQSGWTSVIEAWNDYPGQNWTGWGQDLLRANCVLATPTPIVTPSPDPTPSVTEPSTPTPSPVSTPSPTATVPSTLTWPPLVPTKTDYPVKSKYVVPQPYATPTPTPTASSTPTPTADLTPIPKPAFTVTPQYVVPPLVQSTPTPVATPTPPATTSPSSPPTSGSTPSSSPSPTATSAPTPNPTYTIISGLATPPIPYPSPTVTPEVVAPSLGPDPVFTPVIIAPTRQTKSQQEMGEVPENATVTLVLSNGPSTIEVTREVSALTEQAINAGVVTDPVTELAATGETRRSNAATQEYERAQSRSARAWPRGQALARLSWTSALSDIDREFYVMDGVDEFALAHGPGWYPSTARPGSHGNSAIAGHRLGYGDPFEHLDELKPGDEISLETAGREMRKYRVVDSFVVDPTSTWVLGPDILRDGSDTLTLTTCDPPGVNSHRLVVVARAIPLQSAKLKG